MRIDMESGADLLPKARSGKRLQFSLLSLFALTTLTCLVLSWWVWPQSVEVVSQVKASTTPIRALSPPAAPQPQVVDCQSELLAFLANPQLLKEAVAITGNGDLSMLRGRSDPIGWIKKRLEITTASSAVISVRLTVPEYFKNDAIEFVDYVTLRAFAHVSVMVGRQTRAWTQRLEREKFSLQQQIKSTTHLLNKLKGPPTNNANVAAIEVLLKSQRESLNDLVKDVEFSRSAADRANQPQLVQMATVIDANP
jgi:hypothetical protein